MMSRFGKSVCNTVFDEDLCSVFAGKLCVGVGGREDGDPDRPQSDPPHGAGAPGAAEDCARAAPTAAAGLHNKHTQR